LGEVEATVQVHVDHAAPVRRRQLLEGPGLEDARVADHRVEPPEPLPGQGDDGPPALRGGDRVVRGRGRPAGRLDLADDQVGEIGVGPVAAHGAAHVVDDHGGAPAGQLHGVEPAEAPAGTGHHHHLVREVQHRRDRTPGYGGL
jgi:hypothetical protein